MTQEEKKKPRVERGNGGKLQKTLAEVFTCQGVARGDRTVAHTGFSQICFFVFSRAKVNTDLLCLKSESESVSAHCNSFLA